MLSQYYTEGIFREQLAKYGIHVELSTEVTSLGQDEEGATVALKVNKNGIEEIETIRAAYVIGADGARGMFMLSSSRRSERT